MIKLRTKFLFVSMFSLICSNFSNSNAAERDYVSELNALKGYPKSIPVESKIGIGIMGNKQNKLQSVQLNVIDSLSNAYSMLSNDVMPFSKDPQSDNMVMILRGSHEVTDVDFNTLNSKNNLFIKTSSDNGKTWSSKELVYDEFVNNYGSGRYPSVMILNKGTSQSPDLEYLFDYSLVNEASGEWKGFGTGYKGANGTYSQLFNTFDYESVKYRWGVLFTNTTTGALSHGMGGSKITGYHSNATNTNIIASSPVVVNPLGNVGNVTNIGCRIINEEFSGIYSFIPESWSSKAFRASGAVDTIVADNLGLKRISNGDIYSLNFGQFKVNGNDTFTNQLGVSISKDGGLTWSAHEFFPRSVIDAFIENLGLGLVPSNFFISTRANDFIVFENGDYSIFILLAESSDKPTIDENYMFVELFKENGNFGIRKVADSIPHASTSIAPVPPATQGTISPKYYEFQAIKTADENTIIAKWIEILGEQITDVDENSFTFSYTTSDVFVSKREVGSNTWTPKTNITNDDFHDRVVWLPDLLPNDLTQIPIFRVQSTGSEDLANQRNYQIRQLIMAGTFDATNLNTSVERDENLVEDFNIYPNPTNNDAIITYNLVENSNVNIIVTDYLGNELITKSIDNQNSGINFYTANLSSFANGAYFVSVYANGKLVDTKSLNVIR